MTYQPRKLSEITDMPEDDFHAAMERVDWQEFHRNPEEALKAAGVRLRPNITFQFVASMEEAGQLPANVVPLMAPQPVLFHSNPSLNPRRLEEITDMAPTEFTEAMARVDWAELARDQKGALQKAGVQLKEGVSFQLVDTMEEASRLPRDKVALFRPRSGERELSEEELETIAGGAFRENFSYMVKNQVVDPIVMNVLQPWQEFTDKVSEHLSNPNHGRRSKFSPTTAHVDI